ncbi:Eisosome component PIL1-domain-containing protein [Myxozyma melibiosi]|uniref:Eisosome component PIL1-domain-containing protein n=1 Tax=Myxozyma melibiosi TaxID=54550 RepID=A0ABR1F184_9ASCO
MIAIPSRSRSPLKFRFPIPNSPLSRLVKSFSPVISHYKSAASAACTTAQLLSDWGDVTGDLAVSDVADKFGVVFHEVASVDMRYVSQLEEFKDSLATILDVASSIKPVKAHQAKLREQLNRALAASNSASSPTSMSSGSSQLTTSQLIKQEENIAKQQRKVEQLQREIVRADAESLVADAQLQNATRERLRVAAQCHLDALQERCERGLVLAKYGRRIARLLDGDVIVPGQSIPEYGGERAARELMSRLEDELRTWRPGALTNCTNVSHTLVDERPICGTEEEEEEEANAEYARSGGFGEQYAAAAAAAASIVSPLR